MRITQDLIPKVGGNRPGYLLKPAYITIHDTGNKNAGAGAANHAKYLKGQDATNVPVSWHFTVDDKEIVQHLPLNESGWHATDGARGPGNRTSIGIEIAMNPDSNRSKAEANAAWLVADLLKRLKLTVDKVVQHYHWTKSKNCPQILRGRPGGWDEFIAAVKINMQPKPVAPSIADLNAMEAEITQLRREKDAAIAETNRLAVAIKQIYNISKREV